MDVGRREGQTSHVYVSPAVTYVGYFVVTILVSWLSYRFLERPSIHIGHRLARSLARRGNQEPVPDADAARPAPDGPDVPAQREITMPPRPPAETSRRPGP
jgi:peptidoglycan/LPS O-acetylase OafA/YrhL